MTRRSRGWGAGTCGDPVSHGEQSKAVASRTVAIHQPNVFPWLGYLDKIRRVEEFVFFDNVSAPQGKSWVSRVQVLRDGSPIWLTMPIRRASGQLISEVRLSEPVAASWRKLLGTVEHAYAKAPFAEEVLAWMGASAPEEGTLLADFNIAAIQGLSRRLGITDVRFSRASEAADLAGSSSRQTARIVETCQAFGATTYVSGLGCLDFLEPELFAEAGVQLEFQHFLHPVYPQVGGGPFVPGLSSLDALMNLGFDGVRQLLTKVDAA